MAPQPTYFKTFFSNPKNKEKKCEKIKNNMISCLRNPLDKTNCMFLIENYYLKCKPKPIQKKIILF